MLNIGGWELMVILLVGLVVLGPERLPGMARQMGETVGSLRAMASGFKSELEAASRPDPEPSMTMQGPVTQEEALAATQTDPNKIAEAARGMSYDDEDTNQSAGGPEDLRDEEE